MPAIGTKHRSDNNLMVTTKIYGPTNTFMFDPKDVLREVKRIADAEDAPAPKLMAKEIANCVADFVDYDPNVAWVDCEILTADGVLYYDLAELNEE